MMTSFILGAALLFPMVSCGGSEIAPLIRTLFPKVRRVFLHRQILLK